MNIIKKINANLSKFNTKEILNYLKDLLEKNHFLLEESFKEKILNYVDYLSNTININSIYYRARIGYEEKVKNKYNSNYLDKSSDFVIEQILSHPVTKDEKHLYFISQFFADVFRKIGFDGVLFSSSISQGQNLVAFDPNNFIYIGNSSKVFDIKSLKYTYNELLVNKEEN